MARRTARTRTVEVDPRTEDLEPAALQCRALGHKPNLVPMGPKRRRELAALGQVERVTLCDRCGYERSSVIDVVSRIVVSTRSRYAEGYLINKKFAGSGRLLRVEAYIADLVRSGDLG